MHKDMLVKLKGPQLQLVLIVLTQYSLMLLLELYQHSQQWFYLFIRTKIVFLLAGATMLLILKVEKFRL